MINHKKQSERFVFIMDHFLVSSCFTLPTILYLYELENVKPMEIAIEKSTYQIILLCHTACLQYIPNLVTKQENTDDLTCL